ncbi:hypothetical protein LEP1GSC049_2212 [Leptospira kirschneri serovar Cynopteri str. 3522 CT]|uniref:Uncharacterized protein n=1 Tax=Leptospira kirschneri str. 200802841 TaxID=1193047 RepID=A0A828YAG8_9LEPT|nr:hypothetical protein LEP1GSC131_2461 [Leptospira kirschneri str. 200802841]EMJ85575.1 hypothetical protein LEP1GSC198_0828 [Leptospira kirschneri str. JB]EMK14965.1 hypothetical protein LEP1GSC042_0567 [Leptospira kirschneri serovar Bim str. PUO 1247]EMN04388.1 hypothetical protein LEP1GSC046_4004 [Leptospira kirschneri serovar Bim str. 1051]EMN25657.1 hypothetical protein LEP1GSC065_3862 [Leptospira kirschneri serovar Sokoine str. RM1]EPG50873.1 hypothetical protein LEP1GSC049_2212 [Leptos
MWKYDRISIILIRFLFSLFKNSLDKKMPQLLRKFRKDSEQTQNSFSIDQHFERVVNFQY